MKRFSAMLLASLLSTVLIYAGDDKVEKIGPGVTPPRIVEKHEPEYSEAARAAKISGDVTLSVVVGTDGLAHDINVLRSLEPGLDMKAVEAVQKWRFAPAMKDGKAVAVIANVQVNFRML